MKHRLTIVVALLAVAATVTGALLALNGHANAQLTSTSQDSILQPAAPANRIQDAAPTMTLQPAGSTQQLQPAANAFTVNTLGTSLN